MKRIATAHLSELREKIDSLEQIASTLSSIPDPLSRFPEAPAISDANHSVATASE